jgi:hypothetical protein
LLRDVLEGAVALIVEEVVLAVCGDVEVVVAVVVVVADAGTLSPGGEGEAGFDGDVGEGAVVVVVEEVAGGLFFGGFEGGSVDEEDVGEAVAVVVEDGDAGAGGFDDVVLGVGAAVDVADEDAGFGGYVDEPGGEWVLGGGWFGLLGVGEGGDGESNYGEQEGGGGEAGLSAASALPTLVEMTLLCEHEIRTWLRRVLLSGPWGLS